MTMDFPVSPRRRSYAALLGLLGLCLACGGGGGSTSGGNGNSNLAGAVTFTAPNYAGHNFWVACQDGTGPWKTLTPSGGHYTFDVADPAGRYGVAFVDETPGSGAPLRVYGTLYHFSRAEVIHIDLSALSAYTGAPVSGTVAGVSGTDASQVVLRTMGFNLAAGATTYSFTALQSTADLVALRVPNGGAADRLAVLRDVAVAGPTTLPSIDFSTQGSALVPQTATVTGATPSETSFTAASWLTPTTAVSLAQASAATLAFGAVPPAVEAAGDFHIVSGQAANAATGVNRRAGVFSKTASGINLALPSGVSLPTFSAAATAPYFRPSVAWHPLSGTLITDVYANDGTAHIYWTLRVSSGWTGGTPNPAYAFPDFSALLGWNNAWGLTTNNTMTWTYQNRWSATPDTGYFTGGARAYSDGRQFWVTWVNGSAIMSLTPSATPARGREASDMVPPQKERQDLDY